jgi:glycosyltransferase involved in cell wall biosynthesis
MNSRDNVPTVSVVLSVRNGGSDLPAALDTILKQSFSDFELIVINNGSTDGTRAFLDGITDPRVRVFHQDDKGLASALNRGISLARGRYIARQDHDDLADPSRIEKQVAFLDANPEYGLIGTRAEIWIGDTPSGRFHDHPTEDEVLKFDLLFNNPFVHSSVMMRKSVLDHVGVYTTDPTRQPPEDYELWSRIARHCRVANLAERLTVYREVPSSMSRDSRQPFLKKIVTISSENLAHATGKMAPQQVHVDIAALTHGAQARVSKNPDIKAMLAVVSEAGRKIGGSRPGPELRQRIMQERRRLRLHQPSLKWMRSTARAVRGHVRRIIAGAR